MIGYMGSDFAANIDDRNSTSGYMFHLGSRAISWASRKQPILSLFTKLSMWQQMQQFVNLYGQGGYHYI